MSQWQGELQRRFGEEFVALTSAEVGAMAGRREDNFWLGMDRVIVPLDAVKPLDMRRGWTEERVERYNIARSTKNGLRCSALDQPLRPLSFVKIIFGARPARNNSAARRVRST